MTLCYAAFSDLHKLDVPDILVPGTIHPPGRLQHPDLQGGEEGQHGQGPALQVGHGGIVNY